MPRHNLTAAEEAAWIARGATVTRPNLDAFLTPAEPAAAEDEDAGLVEPSWSASAGRLTIMVPVKTASEANARAWRAKHRRTGLAWKAVRSAVTLAALAPYEAHYAAGNAVLVTFTRLGGRRLDRSNLPTACKATEDAIAFMLGADDGNPRWHARWEQEPGGRWGVRIEIATM